MSLPTPLWGFVFYGQPRDDQWWAETDDGFAAALETAEAMVRKQPERGDQWVHHHARLRHCNDQCRRVLVPAPLLF